MPHKASTSSSTLSSSLSSSVELEKEPQTIASTLGCASGGASCVSSSGNLIGNVGNTSMLVDAVRPSSVSAGGYGKLMLVGVGAGNGGMLSGMTYMMSES